MITIKDLKFGYPKGGFSLCVANLQIEGGEKVAIIGSSGSGKTTLLNLVAGVILPTSGDIRVCDTEVSALSREDRQDFRARTMGMIFQEFELLDYLNIVDNVLLPYRISPVIELDAAARQRAELLVQEAGLSGMCRRYPRRLSQGERQRIAVCRALVTRPEVLVCDEPPGNLDPYNRDRMIETLFRYSDEMRAALVIVTHDHAILERFDRTVDIKELSV